ncbi:MAG: hypothetical protein HOK71_25560 [Planctomycetaceae bacterium]|jgi:lysophospholipase L1-like esterase|nr:hypothetical protein [Planctomycetaceae bacterium]
MTESPQSAESMQRRNSFLPFRRKLCYAAFVCATVLLAIEAAARLVSSDAEVQTRFAQIEQVLIHLGSDPGEIMFEADPERFWRLKPSLQLSTKTDKRWSGMIANSRGFRNREFSLKKPAGTYRIVCIGDSTTFGFGVDWDEAWPHRLEGLLNASSSGSRIEVINAGVPGYTSYQGLQYAKQLLPALQPDLVVVTFGNNDGWCWDNHTDREFARSRRDRAGVPLLRSSRAMQLGTLWYQNRLKNSSRPDHRWADDVWSYRTEPDWTPRVPVNEFAENLSEIALLCHRAGTKIALVQWPDRIQLGGTPTPRQHYLDAIERVCADQAIPRANVVTAFMVRPSETRAMYLPDDNIHVDAAGNRIVARAVANVIGNAIQVTQPLGN